MPTLENRRLITRLIREWKADVVIAPRPNDYHPDHRYTGVLVQDSAYMVTVPFFCPDVPYLKHNPVFLYNADSFQKPNPFQPDIAIAINAVIQKKLDALDALESQFYEGGANGYPELIPSDPAKQQDRHREVRAGFEKRAQGIAQRFRSKLAEFYGQDKAASIQCAEAFEICEYGRRPDRKSSKNSSPSSKNERLPQRRNGMLTAVHAHENLSPGRTVEDTLNYLRYLAGRSHLQEIHFLWRPFLRDADDDMVLELALAAGCRYLVTHNVKDFSGAGQLGVSVVSPGEFLKLTRQES